MNYYWFNRLEILQKKNILEKKLLCIIRKTKKAIKEKSREHYKNLSQEEKDKIKEYQRKKYQELVQCKKKHKKIIFCFFLNIKNE